MSETIAVVGMATRVPDARDVDEFWANLVAGRDSIHRLTDQQLIEAGEDRDRFRRPRYVRARPLLDDVWGFDNDYFRMGEQESRLRNPQHRLFLELCATALQHSGYQPADHGGQVGVYGGCASDRYAEDHVRADPHLMSLVGETGLLLNNNADYLTSFVSYRLGLRGPSMSVRTACSSSLVAIHLACQGLRSGDCELALAGGVEIEMPYGRGYKHVRGGIESADGSCRPLDADASGTVFGSGGGVVVLKRLTDAEADGDSVFAVIRGSAVNNDGADRSTFTSPSAEGQRRVIAEALAAADVDAADVSYVELHGTATQVGDPVEIQGLADAMRCMADKELPADSCAIGSVKSNLGHLGPAAGIAGLIKTVLALHHERIPPTINFNRPNPLLNLGDTPFRVADRILAWPRERSRPRRAGVSSFGFGGTNAHVVLEEAPARSTLPEPGSPAVAGQDLDELLVWSALDETALAELRRGHAAALSDIGGRLPDYTFTTQSGRAALPLRAALRLGSADQAAAKLTDRGSKAVRRSDGMARRPALLFLPLDATGVGQSPWLTGKVTGYLEAWRECVEHFSVCLGYDPTQRPQSPDALLAMSFAAQYALANGLRSLGVRPELVRGIGSGHAVAAAFSGALELAVAVRGALARTPEPEWEQAEEPVGSVVWLLCGAESARNGLTLPDGEFVPVLSGMGSEAGAEASTTADWAALLDALAEVWINGNHIDWDALPRARRVGRIPVPIYPYQRREFILPAAARRTREREAKQ